jgi:tetratricopeptide (TPR) repeat protein
MRTLLVLALAAASTGAQERTVAPAAARVEKEKVQDLLRRAEGAESRGDRIEALKIYDELRSENAVANASAVEAARIRVNATLQSARTMEAMAVADAAPDATLVQARERYEEVVRLGDAEQRLAARNSLGVLLLKQGDKAAALTTLKQIDFAGIPSGQAFVFHANLGRAYAENGDAARALAEYKAAMEEQPTFLPAQAGAFRLLQSRPPSSSEALPVIELLLKKGAPRAAAVGTRDLLVAWQGSPAAADLLAPLAQSYALARVPPLTFREAEWAILAKVTDPQIRLALDQLRHAYLDEIALTSEYWAPPAAFSQWAHPVARAASMARLLRFVGGLHDAAERPRQALASYWAAWLLARDSDDAAATVGVLEAHPDLQTETQLVDRVVGSLFETKGEAYSRQDWPSIMRLHVVLAGIFESQGRWGPAGGSRSAIFQWEHAAQAAAAARREHPEVGVTPGIPLRLAACYVRLGQPRQGWAAYLAAAEAFLADRRPEEAQRSLDQAKAISAPVTPEDVERVKKVEDALGRQPG